MTRFLLLKYQYYRIKYFGPLDFYLLNFYIFDIILFQFYLSNNKDKNLYILLKLFLHLNIYLLLINYFSLNFDL